MLENPEGIIGWYGYETDVPSPDNPAVPQMIPSFAAAMPAEAQKTEPDKNTYLVLKGQKGADPFYDYGTHFLFQGHELGRGGYEGIQNDSHGNIWIVEDTSGSSKQGTTARQPNGFIYRYVPRSPGNLHDGRLQVLQVLNDAGQPVTFESQAEL